MAGVAMDIITINGEETEVWFTDEAFGWWTQDNAVEGSAVNIRDIKWGSKVEIDGKEYTFGKDLYRRHPSTAM